MRIYPVEKTSQAGRVRLSARVETGRKIPELPERIWYDVPARFDSMLSDRMDAFLCALLPLAMALGEDLQIDGKISPKLAYALKTFQKILHFWLPYTFRQIAVIPAGYREPEPVGDGVATAFSGGVDSFYTLRSHLPEFEPLPEYHVTHAIFMNHFDLVRGQEDRFQKAVAVLEPALANLGVQLVPMDYNARDFRIYGTERQKLRWNHDTHGTGLAGAGHVLSRGLKRLYLPSSSPFTFNGPSGTNPRSDHLFSSPSLDVVHHGYVANRLAKLVEMLDWEVLRRNLRVCWWGADGVRNCGRCPKCVRTMIALDLLGRLNAFPTFPKKVDKRRIAALSATDTRNMIRRLVRLAWNKKDWSYFGPLSLVYLASEFKNFGKTTIAAFNPSFLERP